MFSEIEGVKFCFQRLRGGILFLEIEGWDFCFSGVVGFFFRDGDMVFFFGGGG